MQKEIHWSQAMHKAALWVLIAKERRRDLLDQALAWQITKANTTIFRSNNYRFIQIVYYHIQTCLCHV